MLNSCRYRCNCDASFRASHHFIRPLTGAHRPGPLRPFDSCRLCLQTVCQLASQSLDSKPSAANPRKALEESAHTRQLPLLLSIYLPVSISFPSFFAWSVLENTEIHFRLLIYSTCFRHLAESTDRSDRLSDDCCDRTSA